MMYPPIFATATASSAVTALLGTNPTKLFLFDQAPQNTELPYAVWQEISGYPENYLAGRPDIESFRLQIDVYASSASVARDIKNVLEQAIELSAHVVRYNGESRDIETGAYRSSFDVQWFVSR